eukprot:m.1404398 g.1404398  ORF g.1404398 m.1404398 type:complete len:447 (+) comp25012_c0_seq41:2886-4226(+)
MCVVYGCIHARVRAGTCSPRTTRMWSLACCLSVCVKVRTSSSCTSVCFCVRRTALNFFVSLVTKSSVLLSAFVGELPTDPTNAEDVVDVVSHIFDTNSIVVEGGGKGVDVSCLRTFVTRLVAFLEPSSAVPQSDLAVQRPLRTSSLEEGDDIMSDNASTDSVVTEAADTAAAVAADPPVDEIPAAEVTPGIVPVESTSGANTEHDTTRGITPPTADTNTDDTDADMLLEAFDGPGAAAAVAQTACVANDAAVAVVKETAGQKRKRLMKLSKVSVKLTEARIQLEQLVEQEDFMEAATVQNEIAELVAQKKDLASPQEKALAAAAEAAAMARLMASTTLSHIVSSAPTDTDETAPVPDNVTDNVTDAAPPSTTTPVHDAAGDDTPAATCDAAATTTSTVGGDTRLPVAATLPDVSECAEPAVLDVCGDITSNDTALSAAKSFLSRFS